jgi:hypothetical protein
MNMVEICTMYEERIMRPVEIILRREEGNKGEWWKGWI